MSTSTGTSEGRPTPANADASPSPRGQAPLAVTLGGLTLQNPVLLAAGTAAYGDELDGVMQLDALGGLVTKAVSLDPRKGAAAPRVAEFPGGMINAIGLANPGVEEVRASHLPWLARSVKRARVLVNVVGYAVDDFARVIERLDDASGLDGYELNVSCPNVTAGGMEFGADPIALGEVMRRARAATTRPIFVKLSPTLTDIVGAARTALDHGATGLTLVNTMPGLVIDLERRRPALGFGTGGVSGPGLLPVGVLATWKVWKATGAPILGVGGITTAEDALQYLMAGAQAVAIGTAGLRDPRQPARVVDGLGAWCRQHGVRSLTEVTGCLEWPS
ncbi:MAG: dihydroorotate dehydrogenase [Gemmatimonadetes bacterium]|nr:dihydroorotate dehydrogenase [Gemmatimonadota bacterium]MCC6770531.1 dihydroorotate dehydrogenase [Gemmatimonadaceae bacterium]